MAVGTFDRLRAIEREQALPLMRCKALIRRSKERALERLAQITGKVAKPQCVVRHHVAGKRADEWTQTAGAGLVALSVHESSPGSMAGELFVWWF